MDTGRISVRYAKAVYETALDRGEELQVYQEMKILAANFFALHDLRRVLDNPTIPSKDKVELLKTAAGIEVSQTYVNLLGILVANKRESYAFSIALMYGEYYRKQKGIVIAQLTTPQTASPQTKAKLLEVISHLEHKHVDFETHVDPSLVGGFVLTLGDSQLDASIKTQLIRLKKRLLE